MFKNITTVISQRTAEFQFLGPKTISTSFAYSFSTNMAGYMATWSHAMGRGSDSESHLSVWAGAVSSKHTKIVEKGTNKTTDQLTN